MKYKEALIESMKELAKDEKVIFIGEGMLEANAIYSTLMVDKGRVIEFPVAENLIVGSAIGLALMGYKPVVIFQRMDFMLCAADAIINHLSLLPRICPSIKLPVIIRAIVGSQSKKFWCGHQHTKDLTAFFDHYIDTIVLEKDTNIVEVYKLLKNEQRPKMIVEHKDLYNEELV